MKVIIFSDTHFGAEHGTERENDCYEAVNEIFDWVKTNNADLILHAGDMFDTKTPRPDVWAKTLKLFRKIRQMNNEIEFSGIGKDVNEASIEHQPVIAIHGTHERRGRDLINPVQALEHAGSLMHIDRNGVIVEKNDERIAVQGLSGIPELFAKDALRAWNPNPIENCFNIFMIHQSIEPYINSFDTTLKMSDMPKGFDLIVEGHIHAGEKLNLDGSVFLIPGSTIITQTTRQESEGKKGFWVAEIGNNRLVKLDFVELQSSRKAFYLEFGFDENSKDELKNNVEKRIGEILSSDFAKKPIVRIKITGNAAKGNSFDISDIERKFYSRCIISSSLDLKEKLSEKESSILKDLREGKISVGEIGMSTFYRNLEKGNFQNSFDAETIFNLLAEGEIENAMNILTGEQKTIGSYA